MILMLYCSLSDYAVYRQTFMYLDNYYCVNGRVGI